MSTPANVDTWTPRAVLRAVLLDVDGTLYRQAPVRRAMAARLLRHAVRHPIVGARTLHMLRAYRSAQESLRLVADADPARQCDVAAERCGRARHHVAAVVDRWMEREPLALLPRYARPGLHDFLRSVRARGLRVGILSDYPAGNKLAVLGLTGLVDAVVSAQDDAVRRFKPDPAGLLYLAHALRIPPGECLYVGDRPSVDAEAARRAGMPCAIFAPGSGTRAPWTSVSHFAQITALLFG
jgi:HAD superfamily hydrolase (TIGR01549 family)